jgi:exo-1,4-beta-D-glucosaminidase
MEGLSGTYFVDLRLDNGERLESRNFYWLSKQTETVDFENEPESGVWTPTKIFADYTALNSLPVVDLDVKAEKKTEGARETIIVTLRNPSRTLAFGVRLKVKKTGRNVSGVYWYESHVDDEVLPSLWEDNYISLLPGERRQITATYDPKNLDGNAPAVEVSGWNVSKKEARP